MNLRYAVVIEKRPTSYGAHLPDLPGCVAAADTGEEVCALIREAMHPLCRGARGRGLIRS